MLVENTIGRIEHVFLPEFRSERPENIVSFSRFVKHAVQIKTAFNFF
jgi:hypothetical protein